jgi:hypothetical protein
LYLFIIYVQFFRYYLAKTMAKVKNGQSWKLTAAQKNQIIKRLAARDHIPTIAKEYDVAPETIEFHFRENREAIMAAREARKAQMIDEGLRSVDKRVEELQEHYHAIKARLEAAYTVQEELALPTKNGVETVTISRFADAEMKHLRGLLDDIAKQLGQLPNKLSGTVEITMKGYSTVSPDNWDKDADTTNPTS